MTRPHRPTAARPTAARRGRDRRARVLLPPPGAPRADGDLRPSTAVVGGGVAGLAAATALAERGVAVTLYEARPYLGGRVGGRPVELKDGTPATMSRGFHAFFRQYYNLRGLLRRTDPALERLTPLPDYPLRHSDGMHDSFRHVPRTPPWSALAFAALSPSFPLRDLPRIDAAAALPLLDVRVPEVYERLDAVSAHDFLDAVRFPASARHLAFEVFSRSFFADPRLLSAAEMALMFHIYFLGSSEGLLFDVPNAPFPIALWEPLAALLAQHGADLRTSTPSSTSNPWTTADTRSPPTGTSAATTPWSSPWTPPDCVPSSTAPSGSATHPWRERIARLRNAPPFLVSRLWLDRPVAPDRPGFLGTSGYGTLDNVSVLERYEDEAARWAARTGGSVVELHAYALPPEASPEVEQKRLLEQLHRIYPETRRAGIVDARHEWGTDCPLFPVGGYQDRPTVRTSDLGLTVAGDLVRTSLPVALMERAATTGFLAANALLERWGVRGQPLWTVPDRGRSAVLRGLAGAVRRR